MIFIIVRYPLIFAGLLLNRWLVAVLMGHQRHVGALPTSLYLARRLTGVTVTAQLLSGWRAIVATLAGCVWGAGLTIAGRSDRPCN